MSTGQGKRIGRGEGSAGADHPHGSHSPASAQFRPEIEGMRALAVMAVLLYHADLGPFHGGYIGVDVFFVLSGYLITRLMLGEVARSGTVSLPRFWARRARRLLPASALVIVVTVVASARMLDPLTRGFVNRSAAAASLFVANILFWTREGYSQLAIPEPLLHYWSLAVEEQFYLFWPIVLWAISRTRADFRRLAMVVALAIGVVSFVACVVLSQSRQSFAFYWLPTRAWELMAGGAIALAGNAFRSSPVLLRAGAAWFGLVAIVVGLFTFIDPQFQFPGALALVPVGATALVIIGAGADTPGGPGRLLSLRPMMWIGRRSYAIYLWHFPFLVLAAEEWGPLSALQRMLVLGVSIVVAAVSFALVEDPVRRSEWLARQPRRSLALGGALVSCGVVFAVVMSRLLPSFDTGVVAASPTVVANVTTVPSTAVPTSTLLDVAATTIVTTTSQPPQTTSATTPANGSYPGNPTELVALAQANVATLEAAADNEVVPSNLRPSLGSAHDDKPSIYDNGCILGDGSVTPRDCVYGDANSATTVVLFGDSHAAQWFDAMNAAASNQGWRLMVFTKMGCPTAEIAITNPVRIPECGPWREKVLERIAEIHPQLVVLSAYRYKGSGDDGWRRGLDTTMTKLRPNADRVLLLGDSPTPLLDVPSCVSGHLRDVQACMSSRDAAIRPGRLTAEYEVAREHDADFVTTYQWLCTDEWCPVVIGDVLVYRDDSHITTTTARLLTPYIEATLRRLVGG